MGFRSVLLRSNSRGNSFESLPATLCPSGNGGGASISHLAVLGCCEGRLGTNWCAESFGWEAVWAGKDVFYGIGVCIIRHAASDAVADDA